MTATEAQLHIRYSGWASRRALDAALALPPEEQNKPMGVSHESIAKTLFHIYMADRVWYKRTVEPDLSMPDWNLNWPLEKLAGEWQDLQGRWEAWAESLTDAAMDRIVSFKMLNGTPAEAPAVHVVLHLVNHATLHRGQVVGMLRQLGVKPPVTDLIFYLRELAATAASAK
jgi:uncharacterized damage-inducible protein DinB